MRPFRAPVVMVALLIAIPVTGRPQEIELQVPEIITSSGSAGIVEFPHSMHTFDLGIECATCHHETNAAALSIPHEEYFDDFWIECGTCHQSGASPSSPQACSACHHASPTTIADETLSAKVVIHRSCFECHEGGTGQDASRSCSLCHQPPALATAAAEANELEGSQDE